MKILRADLYRLFHSKKLFITLLLYLFAVYFCNYSDILQFEEFISVDSMIDCITESGWFREILYVISALPFALSYCEDVNNNYIISINARTNITAYARSKAIVTILSTFFISLLGFILAIGIFTIKYPMYDKNAIEQLNISGAYGMLTLSHYPFTFFIVRILLFASGSTLWTMISLFISCYKSDYFLITVMPFISSYIIYRFAMNLPDILNIDYCISGYGVIENASILYNFIYALGYIWLVIFIISICFVRKLERSMV